MPPTIYYSLREGEMSRDHLHNRLEQWWKDRVEDPWVKLRVTLLERSCPYYTLPELEELVDLLLHEEEREVLKDVGTQLSQPVRMSQHAYRGYERALLSLARLHHIAPYPRPTTFLFSSFPGAKEGEDEQPRGEVIFTFPYDLRLLRLEGVTYYVSPGDELVIKASPSGRPLLVRGQERARILKHAQSLAPWILIGTGREVQMGVSPQEGPQ